MKLRKLKITIISKIALVSYIVLFQSNAFAKFTDVVLKDIEGEPTYFINSKIEYGGANAENKAALKAKGKLLRHLKKEDKSISSLTLRHFNMANVTRNNKSYIYTFKIKKSDINKQE